jgi:hypothetical protein
VDTRTANREASQVGLGVIEEKLCESNITEQENLWKLRHFRDQSCWERSAKY